MQGATEDSLRFPERGEIWKLRNEMEYYRIEKKYLNSFLVSHYRYDCSADEAANIIDKIPYEDIAAREFRTITISAWDKWDGLYRVYPNGQA